MEVLLIVISQISNFVDTGNQNIIGIIWTQNCRVIILTYQNSMIVGIIIACKIKCEIL